ncbi:uncharacterized protein [Physcomitrium patens]|uniref:Uncharacterized protein n=2 Tax=Physcomitrium patens TaxID=3218 RepID=A0A2K1J0N1_PHYPA|nr:hypothetical protein PHYPA_022982 [Physcomitrium patens]
MLFGSWKGVFELLQQWRWESGRDLKCEIGDQFMLLRVYLFGKAEAKFATGKEDIMASEDVKTSHDKQMWIKYYCEECETWETREMFEVTKLSVAQATPAGACALWSWGCSKLVRHGSFQTFRVDQLNNADGHDVPNLDFPSIESPATTRPFREKTRPRNTDAAEEVSPPQTVPSAQSNGSSQSKRPKRNVSSTYARDLATGTNSPINSQGGVTSSSPDEVQDENRSKDSEIAADTAGPESPGVIDAEHLDDKIQKRPKRLTAGDRGLAQALQYEKPARVTTKSLAEVNNVKPSQPSLATMKRPKRVTAGLRGLLLSKENARPLPRILSKKVDKKEEVHGVRTRSSAIAKKTFKNRRLGDLY